jgi:hypothetical protein
MIEDNGPRARPSRPALACLAFAVVAALPAGLPAAEAAGAVEDPTILFRQGDGGFHTYRIPGVVVTARGSVLAWCEAKKERPWAYACIAATAFDLSWPVWEREDD